MKIFFYLYALLPMMVIGLSLWHFWPSEEQEMLSDEKVMSRSLASENTKSLTYAFNQINKVEKVDEVEIEEEVNHLLENYFLTSDRSEEFQRAFLLARNTPNLFSNSLQEKLIEAEENNDLVMISKVYAIAAALPLGPSPLGQRAENTMLRMVEEEFNWNDEIFRNALQLYRIQLIINKEDPTNILDDLMERATNEVIRSNIKKIKVEIENENIE